VPSDRRGFLKTLNILIGSVVGVAVAIPALRYLVFPTRTRTVTGGNDPVPVGQADAVKDVPVRVEIVVPKQVDAYTASTNVSLGAAWLVRAPDGKIRALSTACPHLGCAVDYNPDAGEFQCPCHKSRYDKDGKRLEGPAKRGMDELDTSVDDDGRVLVKFKRFKPDVPDKEEA
jgi:Rieske Fe-S protein